MTQKTVHFTNHTLDPSAATLKPTTTPAPSTATTKKPTINVFPAVNPVDKCTLKAAVEASIGGKKYCVNSLGESTYSTAEAKCRSRNAKLPMPRNSQENSDFMYVLSKMGLNPHYDTGNPVILGMMDSAVGQVIGKYFASALFAVILKFRGLV